MITAITIVAAIILYCLLFRVFPKAVDELFPLNPPKYTRFVYSGHPCLPRVWMQVFWCFYMRVPYAYAFRKSEMTPEQQKESQRQRFKASLEKGHHG